jgi:hypothetical protein
MVALVFMAKRNAELGGPCLERRDAAMSEVGDEEG